MQKINYKMSLLVVGTVAFDAIETPFGKIDKITGGSGNYICHSAGHFVHNMQLVSVIGDDYDQDELNYLKSIGTDIDGVKVLNGGGLRDDGLGQRALQPDAV